MSEENREDVEEVEGEEEEPRGLYERMKQNDTGSWELWVRIAVGVFALQVAAFAVAFMRLGDVSVYAHSVVIPMAGFSTMLLMFVGLMWSIFRPPVFRRSRFIAFICLLLVGFCGNQPLLEAPVSTGDFVSEHEYYLPFDGPWVTLAGGDARRTNYHAVTPSFRWAYDFAPLVDGSRYSGDGSRLEDHHCYGREVRSPVGGVVVQATGAEVDHPPGEMDPTNLLGNHVVIRVGEGEYLFLGHLKRGSLEVGASDEVVPGQLLARCGNSGRSYTPHLHVHLQNKRAFPIAEGLPLRFSHYLADGEAVEQGMPVGSPDYETVVGEIVENNRPWAFEYEY